MAWDVVAASKGPPLTPECPPKYALVDETGTLRRDLEPLLRREGYQPADPFEQDDGLPPADVVAVYLPADGKRLCARAVEAAGHRPSQAVVVVAECPDDTQLAECVQAGVVAYVGMPLTEEKGAFVVQGVRRRLETRRGQSDGFVVTGRGARWTEINAESRSQVIGQFCRQVEQAAGAGLEPREKHHLAVAVHEMCQNAIEWGNQYDPAKRVRMSYCVMGDQLLIKVQDEGAGFDPAGVPDPSEDPEGHVLRRLSEGKRPGGYGVHLVKSFMDEVTYNQRGNVMIMSKRLAPRPPEPARAEDS